jgi:mannitol-1-phosphate 5-dehydrogenase
MPDTDDEPAAVQIGAGNIGRGFMGELFAAGGYGVTFVDVDEQVVAALADRGEYEIHHVTNAGEEVVRVAGVRAVDARDREAAAEAVAACAVACTAVGVRALEAVAPLLAAGIARRLARRAPPLNVITCENLIGAGRHLQGLVWEALEATAAAAGTAPPDRFAFEDRLGFVEAVVSRMVPLVPVAVRRRDPLWIACEPYARLPVDATAIRGPVPHVAGLESVENILAHQQRKLATHNMSHAVCAYLGYPARHEFIWQAMGDPAVERVVRAAMAETGQALCSRFGFDADEQAAHEDDLLARYRNRALADQVVRVAADPLRKLGPGDRLVGAARLCVDEGVEPVHVLRGVRAALAYDHPGDPSAVRLQQMLAERGRTYVLNEVCGLEESDPLFERLLEASDHSSEG